MLDRVREERFRKLEKLKGQLYNDMKPVHIEKINRNGFVERRLWTMGQSSIPDGFVKVKPKGCR